MQRYFCIWHYIKTFIQDSTPNFGKKKLLNVLKHAFLQWLTQSSSSNVTSEIVLLIGIKQTNGHAYAQKHCASFTLAVESNVLNFSNFIADWTFFCCPFRDGNLRGKTHACFQHGLTDKLEVAGNGEPKTWKSTRKLSFVVKLNGVFAKPMLCLSNLIAEKPQYLENYSME